MHREGSHEQSKKTVHRRGKKIFANDTTNKGLIYKIYKQPMQLNIKNKQNPVQKMGRRTRHFSRTPMETYSKLQGETIKKSTTINAGKGVEKREPSHNAGGNGN